MKECTKCHRTLPESDFYKKSGSPDGLQYVCKECQSDYFKERTKKKQGGGANRVFSNPDLARFTPRQLMEELRARGYTGELKYVQTIKI